MLLSERVHQLQPEITQAVIRQHNERHFWRDTITPDGARQAIYDEAQELHQAIEFDLPAIVVLAEMADIEYFSVCYQHIFGDLPEDVTSIRDQVWQMAADTGVDMNQAVAMKVLRNGMKYPASQLDGTGSLPRMGKLKDTWVLNGGDERFFKWFAAQDFNNTSPDIELEWKSMGGDFDEIIWLLPLLHKYLAA